MSIAYFAITMDHACFANLIILSIITQIVQSVLNFASDAPLNQSALTACMVFIFRKMYAQNVELGAANAQIIKHAHYVIMDTFLMMIKNANYVDQPVVLAYQLLNASIVKELTF